jgi:hypothetical protein
MQATLYCDLGGQTLAESLGGGGFSFPSLVENDEVTLRLRFQARGDNEWFETDREVFALQAGIGLVDARPTGGAFYLPFPGGEGSDPLAFDCSADTFKARLAQAMGVSPSTLEVIRENGSLIVYTANEWEFEDQANTLRPLSFVETERVEVSPGFTVTKSAWFKQMLRSPINSPGNCPRPPVWRLSKRRLTKRGL